MLESDFMIGHQSIRSFVRMRWIAAALSRHDSDKAMLLTGSPRSGTTWAGEVLAGEKSAILFEPFNLRHVPEAKAAGCDWRTYKRRDDDWPAGEDYVRRVLRGRVLNSWTIQDIEARRVFRTNSLLVKSVRANCMLDWFCSHFANPVAVIIRHPCATIASQLRHATWGAKPVQLELGEFLRDHPRFTEELDNLETREERLAATWAMDTYMALAGPNPERWHTFFYESAVANPEGEFGRLCGGLGRELTDDMRACFRRDSIMTSAAGRSGTAGWKKSLSPEQIGRILTVTQSLGIRVYDEDPNPHLDRVNELTSASPPR